MLIIAYSLLNLLYLLFACRLDLAPDEAHYWDWSRNLDWCYYSKGPLIAWLIRASCELFGEAAVAISGTAMPAVRLPAVFCHAFLLLAIQRLAKETFHSDRLALGCVASAMTIPALSAGAVIMTIDSPFLCCWAWACVFTQRAMDSTSHRDWYAAGGMTALGLLAKYTMILFPICVAIYLLLEWRCGFRAGSASKCRTWAGFARLVSVASLGFPPILIWNCSHDWVGFRHLITLASGPDESGAPQNEFVGISGLLSFLAGQFGFLFGYWFIAWFCAAIRFAPMHRDSADAARTRFLWCISVPVWLMFASMSLKATGQANWPAPAYVTGSILSVAWIGRQLSDANVGYRKFAQFALVVSIVFGIAVGAMVRFPQNLRPILANIVGPATKECPTPIRKLDPTCRLEGWRVLAVEVDRIRNRIAAIEGREPRVATMTWFVPGELGFYCREHPKTFTFGIALDDRFSQYDFWRPNPVADAQAFLGETFVYVGDLNPDLIEAFDRIEPPVEVTASDGGIPVAEWKVRVMHGFKGFRSRPASRRAGY